MHLSPRFLKIVIAGIACCALSNVSGVAAASPNSLDMTGPWGTARDIPGVTALKATNVASVTSMSCPAPGDCSVGGYYQSSVTAQMLPFVASESDWSWRPAEEVPGLASLNEGNPAIVTALSCASPGNCGAAGFYSVDMYWSSSQAFVVSETNGVWGTAKTLPGITALNVGGGGGIGSISCARAGDCTVGGYYVNSADGEDAFVATETKGTWGTARPVAGATPLFLYSDIYSISCTLPGDCAAVGGNGAESLVITETNGAWSAAHELSGVPYPLVTSVSCTSPGNCSAGGTYQASVTPYGATTQAFVATETKGAWGPAVPVPGSVALNVGDDATVTSISCAAPGDCSAGGLYSVSGDLPGQNAYEQPFLVEEKGGAWGSAQPVPSVIAANTGVMAQISSISCTAPGQCGAGGFYTTGRYPNTRQQGFVVDESGGDWGAATAVGYPGLNAAVTSVSCSSLTACGAGGSLGTIPGTDNDALIAERPVTKSTSTAIRLSAPRVTFGDESAERVTVTVAAASGTPGGTVLVASGSRHVCDITLRASKGSCALPATEFAPGTAPLTAAYAGEPGFAASASGKAAATVAKAVSKTKLTITPGKKQAEKLTVIVTAQYAGTPAGIVKINAGHGTLCTIALKSGTGNCTLTRAQLGAGTVHLAAKYAGDADFYGSVSTV